MKRLVTRMEVEENTAGQCFVRIPTGLVQFATAAYHQIFINRWLGEGTSGDWYTILAVKNGMRRSGYSFEVCRVIF
jgi:hypothetical protein